MKNKLASALEWALAHKRAVAAVAVVAIPLIARAVPGFPAEDALRVARLFLGA